MTTSERMKKDGNQFNPILERKAKGLDCLEEESAEIKMFTKEHFNNLYKRDQLVKEGKPTEPIDYLFSQAVLVSLFEEAFPIEFMEATGELSADVREYFEFN